jgi:CheY-like chemotaxis protein
LSLVDERAGPPPPAAPAEAALVVEDDVLVRLVIAAYLRDCGYRVFEAASGDEAIKLLERDGGGISVVLTDVEMPGETDGFAGSVDPARAARRRTGDRRHAGARRRGGGRSLRGGPAARQALRAELRAGSHPPIARHAPEALSRLAAR